MKWLTLFGGLAALAVALWTVGALYGLITGALGTTAGVATVAVVAVVVAVVVVAGAKRRRWRANPYW